MITHCLRYVHPLTSIPAFVTSPTHVLLMDRFCFNACVLCDLSAATSKRGVCVLWGACGVISLQPHQSVECVCVCVCACVCVCVCVCVSTHMSVCKYLG